MTDLPDTPYGAHIVHEPHGSLALNTWCGSDLDVVNAARVSFAKQSAWEPCDEDDPKARVSEPIPLHGRLHVKLKDDDEKVLRYLMKNHHGTPFEHNYFQFHVRAPIFVFREWHRHRIGISINEESARYVELKPDFYYPDNDHCRKQIGKPGHYEYVPMNNEESALVRARLRVTYEKSYETYQRLMELGAAKEIARAALPVGIYSQMLWTCNARSLMAFLNLRNSPTALREIRDYAEVMEKIFSEVMPATCVAFQDFGRIAP